MEEIVKLEKKQNLKYIKVWKVVCLIRQDLTCVVKCETPDGRKRRSLPLSGYYQIRGVNAMLLQCNLIQGNGYYQIWGHQCNPMQYRAIQYH